MIISLTLIAFLVLLLAIIWFPFLRQRQTTSSITVDDSRNDTNVALYHEHKVELERDLQEQRITAEDYQYLVNELDRSLLVEIQQNQQKTQKTANIHLAWPIFMSLFVLVFSVMIYQQLGGYKALMLAEQQKSQASEQQIAAQNEKSSQLAELVNKLKTEPENSDLWYQYGQALIVNGEFANADKAFDHVLDIEGDKADIYGAKAQAVYYQHQQKITPQVQTYIDKALALDALDPSTNILLGMNAFLQQNYEQAVKYWQLVINDGRENVNITALKQAVAEAKGRLAMTNGNSDDSNAVAEPELRLNVAIAPKLQQQLADKTNTTVFVYAIASEGRRMPLAALKLRVADLPTQVILNNARAMNPQFNLSSTDKVNIYAVVSMHNSPGIQAGDFQGKIENVDVLNKNTINLEINTLVQ